MLARNDEEFRQMNKDLNAEPTIQVICKGNVMETIRSYEYGVGDIDVIYLEEALTIRMNSTAFNTWLLSEPIGWDPDEGITEKEWMDEDRKRTEKRKKLLETIRKDLGYEKQGFSICQIVAEFFGVVYIREQYRVPRSTKCESERETCEQAAES